MNKNYQKLAMFILSFLPVSFLMYQTTLYLYSDFSFRSKIYVFMGAIILSTFIMALFIHIATPRSSKKGFSPFDIMWIIIFISAFITAFIDMMFSILGVGGLYEQASGFGTFGLLIILEITLAFAIPFFLIIIGLISMTLKFISLASSQTVPGIFEFISLQLNSAIKGRHDFTRAAKKNK